MAMPFHLQKIAFERTIKKLAKDYPRMDTKVAIADQDKWSDSTLTYHENLEGLADYLAGFRIPRAVIITTIDEEAIKEGFSEKEALLAQVKDLIKETPALKPSLAKLLFEEGVEMPEIERFKAEIADLERELAIARAVLPAPVTPPMPLVKPMIEIKKLERQVLAMQKAMPKQSMEEIIKRTVRGFRFTEEEVRLAYTRLQEARLL